MFDWHRGAICCVLTGDASARRDVTFDCRRTLGVRRFRSDLPPDFGLRAGLGRAEPTS